MRIWIWEKLSDMSIHNHHIGRPGIGRFFFKLSEIINPFT